MHSNHSHFLNLGSSLPPPLLLSISATHYYIGHKKLAYVMVKFIKDKIPCSIVQTVALKSNVTGYVIHKVTINIITLNKCALKQLLQLL